MTGEALIEQIKKHEGFREKPYLCSAKTWTFGYGFTFLTEDEADIVLRIKLHKLRGELHQRIGRLSPSRQGVLLNMAFNLGVHGLLSFKKMWAAIDRNDYDWAAVEMLNSRWAEQVGRRAVELAKIMREG